MNLKAFDLLKGNLTSTLITLPIVWFTAAFGEEIVFSGFLMTRFSCVFGQWRLVLVLSVLPIGIVFGYAHGYQGISGQILSGITGMILAVILYRNKNNLWLNIAVHGWFDTIALLLFYFGAGEYL